jgi:hypothetical protein
MLPSPRYDHPLYTVFKRENVQQLYSRWTSDEDTLLRDAVANSGTGKWTCVSKYISGRTAVQCSTRWMGALK